MNVVQDFVLFKHFTSSEFIKNSLSLYIYFYKSFACYLQNGLLIYFSTLFLLLLLDVKEEAKSCSNQPVKQSQIQKTHLQLKLEFKLNTDRVYYIFVGIYYLLKILSLKSNLVIKNRQNLYNNESILQMTMSIFEHSFNLSNLQKSITFVSTC